MGGTERQLYLLLPELFDLAEKASDPSTLERDLQAALSRSYARLAQIQQQLGRHERAVALLDQALEFTPEDAQLHRLRAESLRILGKPDPSARK